jgi:hypothetical protein
LVEILIDKNKETWKCGAKNPFENAVKTTFFKYFNFKKNQPQLHSQTNFKN